MDEGITSIIELLSNGVDISALDFWPQTPVTYALKHGCVVEVIRKLIERGANVNACDAAGLTPLLHALKKKCSSGVISELIRNGANVNVCDSSRPALMYAMDMSEETALLLIDSGADVNARDRNDVTCSMYALYNRPSENFFIKLLDNGANVNGLYFLMLPLLFGYSINIVSRIIKGGADVVNALDSSGTTPLIYAVKNFCDDDVIMELIDCGSDVNKYDCEGKTCLMYALENCFNNDVIMEMINCGSDVNKCDNEGKTCLMYAVKDTWNDNFGNLLKCGASVNACCYNGKSVLMYAIERSNCLEYVTEIINYGCNINVQDKCGRSALMYALNQKSSNEIILKLIDSGADVNLFDRSGRSSLIQSLETFNDKTIVKKLISCTADVNSPDYSGSSPLMYALVFYRDLDVVNELLNRGSDVNSVVCGKSCLIYAMKYHNDVSIVSALLKHGARLDFCDTDGITPLLFAAKNSKHNEGFVCELIKYGADKHVQDAKGKDLLMYALLYKNFQKDFILNLIDDINDLNRKDAKGRTYLMYAIKKNADEEIIAKIIKNGGCVNECSSKGTTALMYAARYCENKKVIQLLISEGANMSCVDNEGNTVLHYINGSDSELMSLFFHKDVSINAENNKKETPLMMAVLKHNIKVVEHFLSFGCNPNCLDCNFNNPLKLTGSEHIANLLIYYGTDTFAKNIDDKILQNEEDDCVEWIMYDDILCVFKNLLLRDENAVNFYLKRYTDIYRLRDKVRVWKLEFTRMKETHISSDLTLYEFCSLKKTKYCKFIKISETDYLLGYDMIEKLFPNFYDIILIKIKDNKVQKSKHDLCLDLERIVMKPMGDVDISDDMLNYDCLHKISQYLNHKQLYNLFLASFL